jgi:hypothetical protein
MILCILFGHNGIKLELNNKKKTQKILKHVETEHHVTAQPVGHLRNNGGNQ